MFYGIQPTIRGLPWVNPCSCSERTMPQHYIASRSHPVLPINRRIWPVNCAIHPSIHRSFLPFIQLTLLSTYLPPFLPCSLAIPVAVLGPLPLGLSVCCLRVTPDVILRLLFLDLWNVIPIAARRCCHRCYHVFVALFSSFCCCISQLLFKLAALQNSIN